MIGFFIYQIKIHLLMFIVDIVSDRLGHLKVEPHFQTQK